MADTETIFQTGIFAKFIIPFALIFFVVFAILEKTHLFGEKKTQINALVAFVIGLIFVGATVPRLLVTDLVLFLAVALIVMLAGILLWGFATGGAPKIEGKWTKKLIGLLIFIALVVVVLVSTNFDSPVLDFFFRQDYSGPFWSNVIFIVILAVVLAVILKNKGGGGKND